MADNLITLNHTQYYQGKDNTQLSGDDRQYGNYQFIKIGDVVNDILATYGGTGMMLDGVRLRHIKYHANRALQELSFDTFRSIKDMEIEIPPSLVMALPHDYVGYVKVTWKDDYGIEHTLFPAILTSNPKPYNQDNNYFLEFDNHNDTTHASDSNTWFDYHGNTPNSTIPPGGRYEDYDVINNEAGQIYGANPQHMNVNGSFYIDYHKGRIHFSSNCTGKTITLKYISDGVAYLNDGVENKGITPTDPWQSEIHVEKDFIVHKFAQEALIKHVLYACMQSKSPVDHNMLALLKKERFAETRKAKIRLSEIKLEEITQILRGKSKWIKH
tara:strand:- start:2276 stop:3259 length:984 start_codon:yes stop_codon:yes gene_type:complete